jgi:hypothetical protein
LSDRSLWKVFVTVVFFETGVAESAEPRSPNQILTLLKLCLGGAGKCLKLCREPIILSFGRRSRKRHQAAFFSFRTPLNFFGFFFTAMNLPSVFSRFVHAVLPISLPFKLRALFHRADAPIVSCRFVAWHFSFSPWGGGRQLEIRYSAVLA